MTNFKKLLVWQEATELATLIDELAKRIARTKPRLADQMERAAAAIPALIAEGSGRGTDRDFANYCSSAIGETSEIENHLQRGYDAKVVFKGEYDNYTDRAISIRRKLIGLRRTLRGQPRRNPKPTDDSEPEARA
jgi:four helix bundle protein